MDYLIRAGVAIRYGPRIVYESAVVQAYYWGEGVFLATLHGLDRAIENAMAEGQAATQITLTLDHAEGPRRAREPVDTGKHTALVSRIVDKMRFLLADPEEMPKKGGKRHGKQ